MSRTIRCKGCHIPETWLISREEYAAFIGAKDVHSYRWFRRNWAHLIKPSFEETRKAELKKAHSEHGRKYFFQGSPPAHFRRDLNAQRRAQHKAEVARSVRKDFGESLVFKRPPSLNDVWYIWD